MNTLKTIYDKLGDKTELAKHEIDLSTLKMLEDDAVRMKKGLDKLKALRIEMKKTYLDSIDKANTNWGDFKQKAKELGLAPDSFPIVKSFGDRQRDLDDAFYLPNKL
jgi:cell fate (sporulation/competence/biofilm development) regulator YmcA (YheA/YmcA/DUF963 family)